MTLACALGPVACGGDSDGLSAAGGDALATSFDLPFGLTQPDGAVPIGRPAVFEQDLYFRNGVPVRSTSLRAAYRITDRDPLSVVRAWVGRIDGLALDGIDVRTAAESGSGSVDHQPWIQASAVHEGLGEEDFLGLELWVTGADPILLVSADRASELPPEAPAITDRAGQPPAPRSIVDDRERTAGDELFGEQGDVIHLPAGTRSLMPTLPTRSGTGGSTSVIAAEDADAAVQALLAEAQDVGEDGAVTGPEVTERDGARIVTASFVITAGGWEFDVVAVRAQGDPYATVYVTSSAD